MRKRLTVLLVGMALLASLLLPATALAYSTTNSSTWNGQELVCTVYYSYYNSSYWRVSQIYCHAHQVGTGRSYVGPVYVKVYSAGALKYSNVSSGSHGLSQGAYVNHNWYPGVLARRYNSKVVNDNYCWIGFNTWRTLHPDF